MDGEIDSKRSGGRIHVPVSIDCMFQQRVRTFKRYTRLLFLYADNLMLRLNGLDVNGM